MRKLITMGLLCPLCLSILCGCGSSSEESESSNSSDETSLNEIQLLVQGNLDMIYLDQASEDYMSLVDITEQDINQNYEEGIGIEAQSVATFFSIDLDLCTDDTSHRLQQLLSDIYSHAKYEVGNATESESGYIVPVTVYPMDIFIEVVEEDYQDAYETDWKNRDLSEATEEELETEWADFIMDLLSKRLNYIDYLDALTVDIRVEKFSNDYYSLNREDFQEVDADILPYNN